MWTLLLLFTFKSYAYESTDNKSQNKFDRIGIIEKYLQNLEKDLNIMASDVENNKTELKKLSGIKADFDKLKNEVNDLKQNITSGAGAKGATANTNSDELKEALIYVNKLKEMKIDELKYKVEVQEFQIKSFLKDKQIQNETITTPSVLSKPSR